MRERGGKCARLAHVTGTRRRLIGMFTGAFDDSKEGVKCMRICQGYVSLRMGLPGQGVNGWPLY